MTEEKNLMKYTTAWLPLVMSLAALLLFVGYVAFVGIPTQPAKDEGIVARIFQLLLVGQMPVMAVFAMKYLRKYPVQTLWILLTQVAVALVPLGTVFFLEM